MGHSCIKQSLSKSMLQTSILLTIALIIAIATAGRVEFAQRNVYSAMILTDPMVADVLGRDFYRVPQGVNGSATTNAQLRIENAKAMAAQLPLDVDFWYSTYAPSCPHRKSKGNDRGVTMSHYQIWLDFLHQGKHNPDAKETDVLVVFEDDAVIAVVDIKAVLHSELSSMDTDLVFLGWCYGRRHMPMCTHAYALTRVGARKIVDDFDICNIHSIDGQWQTLAHKKIFTWRKALPDSLKNMRAGFEDNPNYFTRGIFTQKNGLVSFNHHGFQNNAG